MPDIFDNLKAESSISPALQAALANFDTYDVATGSLDVRGWASFASIGDRKVTGMDPKDPRGGWCANGRHDGFHASETAIRASSFEQTSTDSFARPFTTQSSLATEPTSVVERARYVGRYEVHASDPERMADKIREVIEEVIRYIVSAPGSENVTLVVEVSAENSEGFTEAVARTVRENSKVLGFEKSEFEDVEW